MAKPIHVLAVIAGIGVLAGLPCLAQAQQGAIMSPAALTVLGAPGADSGLEHEVALDQPAKHRSETHKSAKKSHAKARIRKGRARTSFDTRTARSFDPLSLTLAPQSRIDPTGNQYNQVVGTFVPVDKSQLAAAPDDPTTHQISSARIENMEKGNNHTIVVPLFDILNKLSDQPPPSATPDQ